MTYRALQTTAIALFASTAFAASGAALAAGDDATQASGEQDSSSMASADTNTGASASLTVEDQKAVNNTVVIKNATMPEDGFLVIHAADDQGKLKAPESIGHTQIDKGDNKEIEVKLSQSVESGDKLFAMLHNDTGEKGKFEFAESGGKTDGATMSDGKPVIKPFKVK